ncbi:lipid-A-disaccharide synthase [Alphaproteobacteria bacterium]|nr:lipid-A-disaccharide synthase [Alphaproteobacteria bacterium]
MNSTIQKSVTNIVLIAGEPSGDLLGAKLIAELKILFPFAKFTGVGGKNMISQGLQPIFPMEDLTVMGFVEVLPYLPKLISRINKTAQYLKQVQPQIVITIDSPDFCFRVIKKIKDQTNIKKVHLIAPSVWAYRQGRAKKIAKLYDLLLAILPFEPPYFEKHGLKTVFVGHPIIEKIPDFTSKDILNKKFRTENNIEENDLVVCLTPGSRKSEVKKIFPELIKAVNLLAKENTNLKIIIPIINKTQDLVKSMATDLKVSYSLINDQDRTAMFFACNYAIAKSGTNALEFSLFKIPLIVCYKINWLTYYLIKMMVKIKFANLINLILKQEVIPELLQRDCCASNIYKKINEFISDNQLANNQINHCQAALKELGLNNDISASKKSAKAIFEIIND